MESRTEGGEPGRRNTSRWQGGGQNASGNRLDTAASVAGPVIQSHEIQGGVHFHTTPAAAPAAAPAAVRQLLPGPADFIGRVPELRALGLLAEHRAPGTALAVISGPAGVGKTALASHWLRGLIPQYPDGQFYADLRGYAEASEPAAPAEVLTQFLRALGHTGLPEGLGELAALWRTRTAGLRVVVMLDNALTAAQVRPLLPSGTGSLVAVTSRLRLSGLAVDGASFQSLDVLGPDEAVELLSRRIGADRVGREPEATREVAALCAGLPLAVCVAAGRIAVRPRQPVSATATALGRGGSSPLDTLEIAGEHAVRAALDASYRLLSPPHARGYRQLGILPVAVFSAPVVAAACGLDDEKTDRLLDSLAEVHLLEDLGPDGVAGLDRFRFHDLIRAHAAGLAVHEDGAEERRVVVRRAADFYLAATTAAEALLAPSHRSLPRDYLYVPEQLPPFATAVTALNWLAAEQDQLTATLRDAEAQGWDDLVWQLADAMWPLFLRLRPYTLWIEAHERGLAAARRSGDRRGESRMLTSGGAGLRNAGRHEEAGKWFALAGENARQDGDPLAESQALHGAGQSHRLAGRLREAEELFTRALEMRQALGHDRGVALTLLCLGDVALASGRAPDAVDLLTRAREGLLAVRDPYDAARALAHLGQAHAKAGDTALGEDELHRALAEFEETGSVNWQARVLEMLGETAQESGRAEVARERYSRSLALYAPISPSDAGRLADRLARSHG
ncbi:tetratricopeptide repeat protein [uncultured Streptomyces sp.]|uniref:ATP-binding protein n=1 Tax=uncultured Streptomyces sp. TaxID=174707 RepID=UPI002615F1B1|nr:tetratricopeptide repeat protein [uncultured Streptomyces sp.]